MIGVGGQEGMHECLPTPRGEVEAVSVSSSGNGGKEVCVRVFPQFRRAVFLQRDPP